MAHWAGRSKDPILQRWGVGALAHLVAASQDAAARVAEAGGLPALVTGLNCGDPQAQCFASAAIGAGCDPMFCRTLQCSMWLLYMHLMPTCVATALRLFMPTSCGQYCAI